MRGPFCEHYVCSNLLPVKQQAVNWSYAPDGCRELAQTDSIPVLCGSSCAASFAQVICTRVPCCMLQGFIAVLC
jgi:hypothetical protein